MKTGKRNIWFYSATIMLLGIVSIFLVGSIENQEDHYTFDSAAEIDVNQAYEIYRNDESNESLYRLILGMCRGITTEQVDAGYIDQFRELGRQLYRRAKAGTLDLKQIGDPEVTLHMLDLLNRNDVTAKNS